MMIRRAAVYGLMALAILNLMGMPAAGVPWVQFADSESASVCGVVNAANLELVVLEDTGELVSITDEDVVFLDTFVDSDGFVTFDGAPAGFLEFAEDADGFRTLWWFVQIDDVANVNTFTGEPTSTAFLASDYADVPCDACSRWDVPAECADSDEDGIEDVADDCPSTPLDEVVDAGGCSCSQLDNDLDGLDNCVDACPNTPLDEFVEFDGCSCSQLDDDLDAVDNCDDLCPDTAFDELVAFDGCPVAVDVPSGDVVVSFCGGFGAPSLIMMLNGLMLLRMVKPRSRRV